MRLVTGDAELVGDHVRSLRYRVRRTWCGPRPSERIVRTRGWCAIDLVERLTLRQLSGTIACEVVSA